ncbi:Sphingomyelin phosphodiesterase 2 [Sarcoptes scabiei]|nr:Sphingomyelin phosphodiesterase 2 [Sarcoptes scabiei]
MPSKNFEIDNLKIFTLNCWGLRYVSDHREVRMKLIAQHLCDQDYDVVFLQEVWIQSDFEYIRTKTNFKYKFAHIFNNASLLGTSGLVILAKWLPALIYFNPYTINGSPFRPLHGDWFSTKGVAYARIELIGLNLHLFCTHMHAQYDDNEKLIDQYSVHRICQAYELGKFINLMSCNCTNSASKDLIILAGDLNTCSKEIPYRLLTELTDLNDCHKPIAKKPSSRSITDRLPRKDLLTNTVIQNYRIAELKAQDLSDDSSDEELITCGHRENTFTPQQNIKMDKKSGKRIDFIFYKLRNSINHHHHHSHRHHSVVSKDGIDDDTDQDSSEKKSKILHCDAEKIAVIAKDVTGLSFSDHQPVVAKLLFTWKSAPRKQRNENASTTLAMKMSNYKTNVKSNHQNNDKSSDIKLTTETNHHSANSNGLDDHHQNDEDDDQRKKSQQISAIDEMKSEKSMQLFADTNEKLNNSCRKYLNKTSISNKNNCDDRYLIHEIENLLSIYIDKYKPSFKYSFFSISLIIVLCLLLLIALRLTIELTLTETFLMAIIFIIITTGFLFLKFFTHRTEMNAIKAILNDIHKKNHCI